MPYRMILSTELSVACLVEADGIMSTQPSIPPGQVIRVLACLVEVKAGTFTCVG